MSKKGKQYRMLNGFGKTCKEQQQLFFSDCEVPKTTVKRHLAGINKFDVETKKHCGHAANTTVDMEDKLGVHILKLEQMDAYTNRKMYTSIVLQLNCQVQNETINYAASTNCSVPFLPFASSSFASHHSTVLFIIFPRLYTCSDQV